MPRLPVLMYHSLGTWQGRGHALGVPLTVWASHVRALKQEGYACLGLTSALDRLDTAPDARVVALTFDDGYEDFLQALPILAEAESSATLYVPTAYVGKEADWLRPAYRPAPKLMDWDGLAEVAGAGIEIGSHSVSHAQLDVLPAEGLAEELGHSRWELSTRLQINVTSLCYPHGYHSRRVRTASAAAGYTNACEVGRRLHNSPDRMAIPRLAIGPLHSAKDVLRDIETGGPRLAPSSKAVLKPAWRLARRAARAVSRP